MNGMDFPVMCHKSRVFRFGSRGSPIAQSCRTEKTAEDRVFEVQHSLSSRILRAYFRKRAHSSVVGDCLKDFRTKQLREEKTRVIGTLTIHPSSFQTSPGKNLNNGSNLSWVPHNTSNTGSSKPWQQHASPTAVPLVFDSMSLLAMSLTISSTLRQGCIQLCIDGLRKTKTHGQCRYRWVGSQVVVVASHRLERGRVQATSWRRSAITVTLPLCVCRTCQCAVLLVLYTATVAHDCAMSLQLLLGGSVRIKIEGIRQHPITSLPPSRLPRIFIA